MRRKLFSFASVLSLLLCAATAVMWIRSEWVESYAWAGQPGSRSAVIVCEFGHLIIMTSGAWPAGSPWQAASEDLAPPSAYRAGVVGNNRGRKGPAPAADARGFVKFGIARLNMNGWLILPPRAGAMNPAWPVASINILRVSLAWPVAITAVLPTLLAARTIRSKLQTRQRGLCPVCSYNLTGNTSGVCPECGSKIE